MENDLNITTVEFGFKEQILQFCLLNQKKILAYTAAFITAAVLFIAYLSSGPNAEEANRAKETYESWKKNPLDKALRQEMEKALAKIPGLKRAKEAEIIQTLITAGEVDLEAASRTINFLRNESKFHAEFAETSLLIEKQDFQKALEKAVGLKDHMEKERHSWSEKRLSGGSTLYSSNLIRIAFLQKKVGNEPGELAAWEEVREMLDVKESANAALLKANFGKDQFNLTDYISQRELSIIR